MALLLAQGGFADEAVPVLTECLALATNARAVMTDGTTPAAPAVNAAEPPAPAASAPSLADLAGSVERTLVALRQNLAPARAAA